MEHEHEFPVAPSGNDLVEMLDRFPYGSPVIMQVCGDDKNPTYIPIKSLQLRKDIDSMETPYIVIVPRMID